MTLVGALWGLATVTALVVLVCYVSWALLAGETLVFGGDGHGAAAGADAGPHATSPSTLEAPPPSISGAGGSPGASAAKVTVDGTVVALGLSTGAVLGGLIATAVLVRRLRGQRPSALPGDPTSPEPPVAEHLPAPDQAADAATATPATDPVPTPVPPVESGTHPPDDEVLPAPPPDGPQVDPIPAGRPRPPTSHSLLFDFRSQHRVVLDQPCRLQWPGQDRAGVTQSLDVEGLRLVLPATSTAPPARTRVRVTTTLDGSLLSVSAVVTWARHEDDVWRVGLRFDDMGLEQQAFLLGFLERSTTTG